MAAKKAKAVWLVVVAALLAVPASASAGESFKNRTVVVEKQDGTRVEGKLAEEGVESVTVTTAGGESVVIERAAVKAVRLKLRGAQMTVSTKDVTVEGKLVESDGVTLVVETDDGRRVTVDRAAVVEAVPRRPAAPATSLNASPAELPPSNDEPPAHEKLRRGYAGLEARFEHCLVACKGTIPTIGAAVGYKYGGAGVRLGFMGGVTFVFPDLRAHYDFEVVPRVVITPLVEFTPMVALGGGVTVVQLILRPGFRFAYAPAPYIHFYVEPAAFDIGVFSTASGSGGSVSSGQVVVRYVGGGGIQYRF